MAHEATSPARDRWRRARSSFRGWRRSRPFWGGLITLLAGLEFYLSVHENPLTVAVSFGQQGFMAWLLPLVLLLCGILGWFSPQRVFYGVIAAATGVYGLIGLNLGGFLLGTVLGVVGGALLASWVPLDEAFPLPDGAAPGAGGAAPAGGQMPVDGDPSVSRARPEATAELTSEATTDGTAEVVPGAGAEQASSGSQGSAEPLGGNLFPWLRRGGAGAVLLLAVVGGAAGVGLPADPAAAASCPPSASATSSAGPSSAPSSAPSAVPIPSPATQSPTPSTGSVASADAGTAPPGGGTGGAGTSAALASVAAMPSAATGPTSATGSVQTPAAGATTGCLTSSPGSVAAAPSTAVRKATVATAAATPAVAAAAGSAVPRVAAVASLTADSLQMHGLSYAGVVDLTRIDGSMVRVLKFSMTSATHTPFRLQAGTGGGAVLFLAGALTISGQVSVYCTGLSGTSAVLGPVAFTLDAPPRVALPDLALSKVTIDLVDVQAQHLTATGFGVTAG